MYRIRGWDEHFESNDTRKRHRIARVMIPNKLDGDGYISLVAHERGAAHFGVWIALIQIASRGHPRGELRQDTGKPHTVESLAFKARMPAQLVEEAVGRLVEMGWVEDVSAVATADGGTPAAATPARRHPRSAVQRENENENENENDSENEACRRNGTPVRSKSRLGARRPPRPRYAGSSLEWDGCARLASDLDLDATAKSRLESSPLDDSDLYRLLSDARDGRGRIKNPSRWVVTTLSRLEAAG